MYFWHHQIQLWFLLFKRNSQKFCTGRRCSYETKKHIHFLYHMVKRRGNQTTKFSFKYLKHHVSNVVQQVWERVGEDFGLFFRNILHGKGQIHKLFGQISQLKKHWSYGVHLNFIISTIHIYHAMGKNTFCIGIVMVLWKSRYWEVGRYSIKDFYDF